MTFGDNPNDGPLVFMVGVFIVVLVALVTLIAVFGT